MKRQYNDPAYKLWRKKVYERDKYTCQWPGCCKKSKLNAHHIKLWAHNIGLRFDINNGITLCYDHHKMVTGMEDIYESIFLKILAQKNYGKA